MSERTASSFVRRAVLADALVSGVTGVLLTLTTPLTAPLFGLPGGLLAAAGMFCIAYGATLGWLARVPSLSTAAVRTIVAGNAGWVAASVALMLAGPASMTTVGMTFVGLQAAVVALLAELQWTGLRRQRLLQVTA